MKNGTELRKKKFSAILFLRTKMAERVGFEPTVPCDITGFQDRLLKPLGHLSAIFIL